MAVTFGRLWMPFRFIWCFRNVEWMPAARRRPRPIDNEWAKWKMLRVLQPGYILPCLCAHVWFGWAQQRFTVDDIELIRIRIKQHRNDLNRVEIVGKYTQIILHFDDTTNLHIMWHSSGDVMLSMRYANKWNTAMWPSLLSLPPPQWIWMFEYVSWKIYLRMMEIIGWCVDVEISGGSGCCPFRWWELSWKRWI